MNPEASAGVTRPDIASLSRRAAWGLFLYYTVIMCTGCIGLWHETTCSAVFSTNDEIRLASMVAAISAAMLGSGISYSRKLYKLLMNQDGVRVENSASLRHLGLVFYLSLRPVYSIGLAIVFVLVTNTGVLTVTRAPTSLDTNFIIMNMIPAFFIGLLCGRILDSAHMLGLKWIDKLK